MIYLFTRKLPFTSHRRCVLSLSPVCPFHLPSQEDKGAMWELFQSCMRVFRTGAAACTNQTEPCCVVEGDPKTDWVNVWSLTNGAAAAAAVTTAAESNATVSDHLLTVDENERDVLVAKGWHEVCAPAGGSTAFCQYKVRRPRPTAETATHCI
eukprot:COSAG06_NODE_821_length_12096_cov_5.273735_15_plen_153_part_00